MHVILLALGLVAIVAGGIMVGFGIPENQFGTGTLIGAGVTAMIGGLIVIGLSAIVRDLDRLVRALGVETPPRPRNEPRPVAAVPPPEPVVGEVPAKSSVAEPPATPPPAPARADSAKGGSEVTDLSRVLAQPPVDFSDHAGLGAPGVDPFAPARSDAPRPVRERRFDEVWPKGLPSAPSKAAAAEAASGPADPATRPAEQPPRPLDQASPPADQDRAEPVSIKPSRGPQAVTILKSGVIDGMAYTLYSDGSIEAELPQGMLRFGSIDELRRYIADQG